MGRFYGNRHSGAAVEIEGAAQPRDGEVLNLVTQGQF